MKVKRIGTLKTYRQYEKPLLELIQKYLPKSGSHESVGEILSQIRMECHNPFFFSCIVLDDADIPVGFVIATVSITRRGKRIFIEHMHAPNLGMADKLHEMMMAKLGVDDVWWLTHRDPSAWIKFCKKRKHPVELYGWMIRTVPDMKQFGQVKED